MQRYTLAVTSPEYWSTIHNALIVDSNEDGIPDRKITCTDSKNHSPTRGTYELTDEEVEEKSDEDLTPTEQMREYVEKVTAKMGDNGANTKSPVAGPNDMGGTASNLVQGADEKGMTPASPKDIASGNVNVPGGKASKSMKNDTKGHGAEKKGAGDTAANKKSTIGS